MSNTNHIICTPLQEAQTTSHAQPVLRDIGLHRVILGGNLACLLMDDGKLFVTHNSKDPELLFEQCKKNFNAKDWLEMPILVKDIAIGSNKFNDFCIISEEESLIYHCRL
jgi:hypothetical protein